MYFKNGLIKSLPRKSWDYSKHVACIKKKINDILGFCSQNYEATLSLFLFIDFNTSIVGHFHYEQMLVNLCTVNLKHMKRLIPISGIYVGMFGRTDECYPNDTQYI